MTTTTTRDGTAKARRTNSQLEGKGPGRNNFQSFSCYLLTMKNNQLHNLTKTYPPCLMDQVQDALSTYNYSCVEGEEQLKALSLWPVENIFWWIRDSDPHAALSFDRLHASHDSAGGRNALQDVKRILSMLGHEVEAKVEAYISNFPRWCGLSHFKNALNVTFLDGNKKHDLAKDIFYACLNVLTKDKTPKGYCLLHVLASYLELDSLISLDIHTERMIEMIEAELLRFSGALKILHVNEHQLAAKLLRMHIDHHMNWSQVQAQVSDGGLDLEETDGDDPRAFEVQKWIIIPPDLEIRGYKYLKVNYESLVDWKLNTNHLRCNPMFHGAPQYDCAVVQLTEADVTFIRLMSIFSCKIPDICSIDLAFVQPFTAKTGASH
ncbi:hypothetical protein EDD16DRAFT_1523448 [Pisolithus croceorrhizus]|nr:hypothetical protein EDD16DRAFT_1523448 [Pisolithus croceorrhizus]